MLEGQTEYYGNFESGLFHKGIFFLCHKCLCGAIRGYLHKDSNNDRTKDNINKLPLKDKVY